MAAMQDSAFEDITLDDLSPMLRELAEAIGIQDTLTFMRAFSGRWIGVPITFSGKPDHPLIERLGEDLANRILEFYSGQCVQVPCGKNLKIAIAKRRVCQDWQAGELSYSDIAQRHGVHVRTVYDWVREWKTGGKARRSRPKTSEAERHKQLDLWELSASS